MFSEIKNIQSEKSDLRKFGVTVGIILLLFAGLLFWKDRASFKIFLAIGTVLIASGIVLPVILKPVYRVWMTFAIILGWFMTGAILFLLFYGVFTPIGFIMRLFGKQFLDLKLDKEKSTYWNYRATERTDMTDYEKQF